MMVQRMIGSKYGTGGSSGYQYLRATVRLDIGLIHILLAHLGLLAFKSLFLLSRPKLNI